MPHACMQIVRSNSNRQASPTNAIFLSIVEVKAC